MFRLHFSRLVFQVLPPHEVYWCHVIASPVTTQRGGVEEHVLLLSSAALYVLLPEHSIPTLTLPMHHVERLEVRALVGRCDPSPESANSFNAPPYHTVQGTPHHATDAPKDGSTMVAIFLYPAEAKRLGIPSCVQYSLTVDASCLLTAMHEQNQIMLASSFVQEPAWLRR